MKHFHIECRVWWSDSPYNTVRIYHKGRLLGYLTRAFGAESLALERAIEWLEGEGYIYPRPRNDYNMPLGTGTRFVRETLASSYSTIEVQRRKDL